MAVPVRNVGQVLPILYLPCTALWPYRTQDPVSENWQITCQCIKWHTLVQEREGSCVAACLRRQKSTLAAALLGWKTKALLVHYSASYDKADKSPT